MVLKPMSYSIETKEKAIKLRRSGYSLNEIAKLLGIAKSTSSAWLNTIKLNKNAQMRLQKLKILGQYKSMQIAKEKRDKLKKQIHRKANHELKEIKLSKSLFKLLVSLLFWTEGGKSTDEYVFFTNSDPNMVALFVYLLRESFNPDESKFRAMIHIHEYHDEKIQLKFWSKITNIPVKQFSKSYHKPHTGKRIRKGYQGSIRIRYYDHKIALELRSFYNTFIEILGL